MIIIRKIEKERIELKGIGIIGIGKVEIEELVRNKDEINDGRREKIEEKKEEKGMFIERMIVGIDEIEVLDGRIIEILEDGIEIESDWVIMDEEMKNKMVEKRWKKEWVIIVLEKILERRMEIEKKRNLIEIFMKVIKSKLKKDMERERIEMDRRIGGEENGGIEEDRIDKGLISKDIRWFKVLMKNIENKKKSKIGELMKVKIRWGDRRRERKMNKKRLGKRINGSGSENSVEIEGRWRRRRKKFKKEMIVDLEIGKKLERIKEDGERKSEIKKEKEVKNRKERKRDGRNIEGRRWNKEGGSGIVEEDGKKKKIERIEVKKLEKKKIGKIEVEKRSGEIEGLMNGMKRKLDEDEKRIEK